MAGERIGILNEAIVFTALKRLDFGRKVFWNAKPDRFSVEPDFTIGPSVSEPEIQILVTHSGSAKNSNMKFWRNIAELSEAKIRLPSPPRVFSIFFASHFYRDLLTVTEAAFDGQLLIDRQSYGEALTDWIHESGRTLPAEALEKQSEIERIQAEDPTLDQLVQKLATDLRDLLTSHNASLDPLWHLERKRPKTSAPVARETFVRRGLAKLLAFPDVEKALQLYRGKPFFADTFPDFVYKLGFVARGISHHFGTAALPSDSELENAVSLLHPEEILTIAQNPGSSGFTNQLTKIRGLATFPHLCKFVQRHRSRLTKFEGMLETLESQHSKPTAGIRIPKSEAKPTNVWIFDVISAPLENLSRQNAGLRLFRAFEAAGIQAIESRRHDVGRLGHLFHEPICIAQIWISSSSRCHRAFGTHFETTTRANPRPRTTASHQPIGRRLPFERGRSDSSRPPRFRAAQTAHFAQDRREVRAHRQLLRRTRRINRNRHTNNCDSPRLQSHQLAISSWQSHERQTQGTVRSGRCTSIYLGCEKSPFSTKRWRRKPDFGHRWFMDSTRPRRAEHGRLGSHSLPGSTRPTHTAFDLKTA